MGAACHVVTHSGEIVSNEEFSKHQTQATYRFEDTLTDDVV